MTPSDRPLSILEQAFEARQPPSTLDHRVMVLDVASRLRAIGASGNPAVAARDVDALYDLISPAYRDAGLVLTEGVIHDALDLASQPSSVLDLPSVAPWRQRLATAILTRRVWWPKYRLPTLCGSAVAVVLLIATPVIGHVRFDRWVSQVRATAQRAEDLRSQLSLVEAEAGSLGGDVAGARVHAGAARQAVGAASSELAHVHAWSDDPDALRQAYALAAGSAPADQLVREDQSTLDAAAEQLHRAKSEIALAQSVIQSSQTWQNMNLPASLPAALTDVWEHDAALMRSALASGDVNAISRADSLLKLAMQSGADYTTATSLIAALPAAAQPQAEQLLEHFNDLVAAGDAGGIHAILDELRVMKGQVPLAYNLSVVDDPGQKSGVVRGLAGAARSAAHYLIVRASDAAGRPIEVPVFDTESRQIVTRSTFGVEVSPAVYDQFRARKRAGQALGLIGQKAPGEVAPSYTVPVGSDTITQW